MQTFIPIWPDFMPVTNCMSILPSRIRRNSNYMDLFPVCPSYQVTLLTDVETNETRQAGTPAGRRAGRHARRPAGRKAARQACIQASRQAGWQAGREAEVDDSSAFWRFGKQKLRTVLHSGDSGRTN